MLPAQWHVQDEMYADCSGIISRLVISYLHIGTISSRTLEPSVR